jgi:hypothetical protein
MTRDAPRLEQQQKILTTIPFSFGCSCCFDHIGSSSRRRGTSIGAVRRGGATLPLDGVRVERFLGGFWVTGRSGLMGVVGEGRGEILPRVLSYGLFASPQIPRYGEGLTHLVLPVTTKTKWDLDIGLTCYTFQNESCEPPRILGWSRSSRCNTSALKHHRTASRSATNVRPP